LLAVALLPLVSGITGGAALLPSHFAAGFRTAVVIAGITSVAGGLLAIVTISNPTHAQGHQVHRLARGYHCAVDGAPLQPAEAAVAAAE
jgi:hypothetical protein